MSRVLVTGAAGFVGSAVVRSLLRDGEEVAALVRPGTSLHRLTGVRERITILEAALDVPQELRGALERSGAKRCIHLAWYARPDDYLRSIENTGSLAQTLSLIPALADAGFRHIVVAGSCAEYDLSTGKVLDEESPLRPSTVYGAAKLSAFLIGARIAEQCGTLALAHARLFYMFGPREDGRRVVPSVIAACLRREPLEVSAGAQVRDFLHIDDIASALCVLSRSGSAGAYNVCSSEPVTMRTIFETVERITGANSVLRIGARPYSDSEAMFVCGSNAKLKAATGWQRRYPLEAGLRDAAEWWRSHGA